MINSSVVSVDGTDSVVVSDNPSVVSMIKSVQVGNSSAVKSSVSSIEGTDASVELVHSVAIVNI